MKKEYSMSTSVAEAVQGYKDLGYMPLYVALSYALFRRLLSIYTFRMGCDPVTACTVDDVRQYSVAGVDVYFIYDSNIHTTFWIVSKEEDLFEWLI